MSGCLWPVVIRHRSPAPITNRHRRHKGLAQSRYPNARPPRASTNAGSSTPAGKRPQALSAPAITTREPTSRRAPRQPLPQATRRCVRCAISEALPRIGSERASASPGRGDHWRVNTSGRRACVAGLQSIAGPELVGVDLVSLRDLHKSAPRRRPLLPSAIAEVPPSRERRPVSTSVVVAGCGLPASAARSVLRAARWVTAAPAIRSVAARLGRRPDGVGIVR